MRILITGGAGTLGSSIADRFQNQNIEFFIVDNFETGNLKNIQNIRKDSWDELDILDEKELKKVFKDFKPNCIIHSAASYKDPNNWIRDAEVNILGSIKIAELSKRYNVEKIINFQTALCYGRPKENPIKIDHSIDPISSYGISKAFGESYLLQHKIPTISLRLANICSKNLAIGPIPTFYNRIKEGKECFISDSYRDFLDFDDFYELLMKVIKLRINKSKIFNVSTGISSHISEIFNIVKKYLKKNNLSAPIKPIGSDDIFDTTMDSSLTESTFNWYPKVGLEEMINKQLQFYEKEPVKKIFSHLKNE
jgi:nucleoside-diphosphate-sugar epimerase